MEKRIKDLLESVVQKSLEICPTIENIILFGSYAWGDNDEGSDLDLFILFPENPEEMAILDRKLWSLFNDLSLENDIVISNCATSREIFDRFRNASGFFKNVIKDGIVLYGPKLY